MTIIQAMKEMYANPVSGKHLIRLHLCTLAILVNGIVGGFVEINIYNNFGLTQLILSIIIIYQLVIFRQMSNAQKARRDFNEL